MLLKSDILHVYRNRGPMLEDCEESTLKHATKDS